MDLMLLFDLPEDTWMDRSLCSQTDPEAFFPEKGGSTTAAKQICEDCPVRAECLDYALQHEERFGIWGGLSERERRALKHQIAAADRTSTSTPDATPDATPGATPVAPEDPSRTAA